MITTPCGETVPHAEHAHTRATSRARRGQVLACPGIPEPPAEGLVSDVDLATAGKDAADAAALILQWAGEESASTDAQVVHMIEEAARNLVESAMSLRVIARHLADRAAPADGYPQPVGSCAPHGAWDCQECQAADPALAAAWAAAKAAHHAEHNEAGPAGCPRCQMLRRFRSGPQAPVPEEWAGRNCAQHNQPAYYCRDLEHAEAR